MTAFIQFFNSLIGRFLRVVLGLALIGSGWFGLGGTAGVVVAVVGLAAIALGVWGHCLIELFSPRRARTV